MNRSIILKKINFWLLSLIVVAISLEKRAIPYLIAGFVVSFLLEGNFIKKWKRGGNKFTFYTISYYLFLIIGCFYSANLDAALFDLEVKFSILLFPLIFPYLDLTKKQVANVFLAYIMGCLMAFLICLSMATIYFFSSYDPSVFYYDKLSVFHHPTYFSMYLNFAIVIIYFFLINGTKYLYIKSDAVLIALVVVFSVFVVLLSSKLGLISLLFIIFGGTIWWFLSSRAIFPSILVFVMVSSLIYVSFKYSSSIQSRINEAVKSITEEDYSFSTTSARIAIWEVAVELVSEAPFVGYGTGDIKDILIERYKERGYGALYRKRLNAHNQYVQAAISIGLIGLFVFMLSIFYPIKKIWKERNMMYGGFIFIMAVNFLTESVLETQAGVVFYAFFNSFLFYNSTSVDDSEQEQSNQQIE